MRTSFVWASILALLAAQLVAASSASAGGAPSARLVSEMLVPSWPDSLALNVRARFEVAVRRGGVYVVRVVVQPRARSSRGMATATMNEADRYRTETLLAEWFKAAGAEKHSLTREFRTSDIKAFDPPGAFDYELWIGRTESLRDSSGGVWTIRVHSRFKRLP